MTAAELILKARVNYLSDAVRPYLWSDLELLAHLNWAYKRAVTWSRAIRDNATPAVCTLTLVADHPVYALDHGIIAVKSITLNLPDTTQHTLDAINAGEAQRRFGTDWQTTTGDPSAYVPQGYSIRLVRVPSAEWGGQTLTIDCHRLPLTELTLSDTPDDFNDIQQEGLIYGLLSQAYLKHDADAGNLERAKVHYGNFIAEFGPPITQTTILHNLQGPGGIRLQPTRNAGFNPMAGERWGGGRWA
jgi:hypothetical protein